MVVAQSRKYAAGRTIGECSKSVSDRACVGWTAKSSGGSQSRNRVQHIKTQNGRSNGTPLSAQASDPRQQFGLLGGKFLVGEDALLMQLG
jgi:hypothetical protein